MSEYQFFDFQTIDRVLTEQEQAEIHKLSSRVALTPTQAVFTYQFGDFRGKPEKVLAQYFDAMLYLANWGTRQLMFRFPKSLIDLAQAQLYKVEDVMEFQEAGNYILLDIRFDEEDVEFWIEGEGRLSSLVRLRDDVLRQDYRLLYLAWLKAISINTLDESEHEPPVPPGLHSLSAALRDFVDLFELDKHLLAVAARASGDQGKIPAPDLRQAIHHLSRKECDDYLLRLAKDEPYLSMVLNTRLRQGAASPHSTSIASRTVKQLLASAEQERDEEKRRHAQEAEEKRIQELEALARREGEAWQQVETLLQKSNAKTYDQAVQLLSRLREVAARQKQEGIFQKRLNGIHERYKTRHSLIEKLRAAGLYNA
ncbi:MAG: hypothetical protein KGJ80_11950 [Chloroflexota bacterium]|nr:hypothetical protein [Chloroflexota bacterium]